MKISRRKFLVTGATSATFTALNSLDSPFFGNLAFAAPGDTSNRDILVILFLRGGCDGLSLVAPVSDKNYIAARSKDLLVKESGEGAGLPIKNPIGKVDFRFHPKAAGIKELYDNDNLAVIHAAGLRNGTRSHFEAQDLMERGVMNDKNTNGWLTRHLESIGANNNLSAMSVGANLAGSYLGSRQAVSITDVSNYRPYYEGATLEALKNLYKRGQTHIHRAGVTTLSAVDTIQSKLKRDSKGNVEEYKPENNASYPPNEWEFDGLGKNFKSLARLIKMDIGLQVATIDCGGWDTHQYQAWHFAYRLEGLNRALTAFYNDVSRYHKRLTLVVMSEFGRRLKSNESYGTDHGYGNVMMVLGGNINGGRMFGTWKGLETENLDQGADLDVTTDYRTVLTEVLQKRIKNPSIDKVFPNFREYKPLGITKSNSAEAANRVI